MRLSMKGAGREAVPFEDPSRKPQFPEKENDEEGEPADWVDEKEAESD